jgi:hypothetical protein
MCDAQYKLRKIKTDKIICAKFVWERSEHVKCVCVCVCVLYRHPSQVVALCLQTVHFSPT